MSQHRRARRPLIPVGPDVPDRAGGPFVCELCRAGDHGRCHHPSLIARTDGCRCWCREEAA